MPGNGWIKIHRKILAWEWYNHLPTRVLFLHLLLKANYEDKEWRGMTIKRGQLVTSIRKLAKETGLSVQHTRCALLNTQTSKQITRTSTNRFTLITVLNYDLYQSEKHTDNTQTGKRITHQSTTTKEERSIRSKNKYNNVPANWKKEYGQKYIDGFNKLFGTNYRLTPAREIKLKERFKEYTTKEMETALVNLANSKFHRGINDRGWKADPDFLIRSDEQVDKWLNAQKGKNE